MNMFKVKDTLEKIYASYLPEEKDLEYLLGLRDPGETALLFGFADKVRREFVGDGIFLRGIIEFSNFCRNNCFYCGLNRDNLKLARYRMTGEEIMQAVRHVVSCGIKTVVLQSGEDGRLDPLWLKELIEEIKSGFDVAITLSLGERAYAEYKMWREAGAERYLLKIETSDRRLYAGLHAGASFENRLRCLSELKGLGYEVGCGNMVGLKGQTLKTLAQDLIFFKHSGFDMIGIGPFIPHPDTELASAEKGSAGLTLKVLALARILTKYINLPATTALGSLEKDFRIEGLQSGANVLMPNFTPLPFRRLYEIYPGKRCIQEQEGLCVACMEAMANSIGRFIDYDKGGIARCKIHRLATGCM